MSKTIATTGQIIVGGVTIAELTGISYSGSARVAEGVAVGDTGVSRTPYTSEWEASADFYGLDEMTGITEGDHVACTITDANGNAVQTSSPCVVMSISFSDRVGEYETGSIRIASTEIAVP